jgi:hypothetical protein
MLPFGEANGEKAGFETIITLPQSGEDEKVRHRKEEAPHFKKCVIF